MHLLILLGIFVLILLIALAVTLLRTFAGIKPIPERAEFDGITIVKDGMVTLGVIPVGPNQIALVDAGVDPEGKAILAELSRRNLGPEAVIAILLTHGHRDHVAAVSHFPNAKVMSLTEETGVVEGREGTRGPVTRLFPVKPTGIAVDRQFHDGESFAVADTEVRVFAVPGHTRGSAAYLVCDVLFLGDAANATRNESLQPAPWLFTESVPDVRNSLVRLAQRLNEANAAVKHIVFGHSGALSSGLAPLAKFAQIGR